MPTNPPSAAASIYPHLQRDEPPKQQQRAQSLSSAMYPKLAEKAENEWRERNRKTILPDLLTKRGP